MMNHGVTAFTLFWLSQTSVNVYSVVMGDTKNIDSITITTTFRTKYRSIDYSNDYLLRNSSNMLVISYKYFYTIKNNSITLLCLQKLSSRNNSTSHFVKKAADLL